MNIFISFKHSDEVGASTRDSVLGSYAAKHLRAIGHRVFFAPETLIETGSSDYKKSIDKALDEAEVLIAVGTSPQHLESEWVRYEWDSFCNDVMSKVKPQGRLFVYYEGFDPKLLPRGLRQMQAIRHSEGSIEQLISIIAGARSEVLDRPGTPQGSKPDDDVYPNRSEPPADERASRVAQAPSHIEQETRDGLPDGLASLIDRQSALMSQLGHQIVRLLLDRPDKSTSMRPVDIAKALLANGFALARSVGLSQLTRLVVDAQRLGFAPGVTTLNGGFLIVETHISYKLHANEHEKQILAKYVVGKFDSGNRIAFDGGSTSIEVAKQLLELIQLQVVSDITIITNSILVLQLLCNYAIEQGWSGDDAPMQLIVPCGTVRLTTMALDSYSGAAQTTAQSIQQIALGIGKFDYAIVGGNGVSREKGITIPTINEIDVKRAYLESAVNPMFVLDSSKFQMSQSNIIATWEDKFSIVTSNKVTKELLDGVPSNSNIAVEVVNCDETP